MLQSNTHREVFVRGRVKASARKQAQWLTKNCRHEENSASVVRGQAKAGEQEADTRNAYKADDDGGAVHFGAQPAVQRAQRLVVVLRTRNNAPIISGQSDANVAVQIRELTTAQTLPIVTTANGARKREIRRN